MEPETTKPQIGFVDPGTQTSINEKLDLNRHLIKHPAATFFIRAVGDSMRGAGIKSNDLLVVDRALVPNSNSIIVATLKGEFLVRRMHKGIDAIYLTSENSQYKTIRLTDTTDFEVWGVVTHVIHTPVH